MRFAWLMAVLVALWVQPAHAVVDIKSGNFSGVITSGTATVTYLDAPAVVEDLSGGTLLFSIYTTLVPGPNDVKISTGFIIFSSNQYMHGFSTAGDPLPEIPIILNDNRVHIVAAVAGGNNATVQYDLIGPLFDSATNSLTGSIKGTYPGFGSYLGTTYDFTVDLRGFAYFSGVPEPASWVLLIIGIGIAGAAMRRRQEATVCYTVERL